MSEQNWRTEIDAQDYFLHQKKKTTVADRRPVIRRASDLVGPGIERAAIPVTDYNDLLATYNGYFSSTRARNGPRPTLVVGPDFGFDTNSYVGTTVMDSATGGRQEITDLVSGNVYQRLFVRAPADPGSITWGQWVSSSPAPPTAFAQTAVTTLVPTGSTMVALNAPTLDGSNWEDTYEKSGTKVIIHQPGIYTGVIRVTTNVVPASVSVEATLPKGAFTETMTFPLANAEAFTAGVRIPFTFVSQIVDAEILVKARHASGFTVDVFWSGMDITRVGSAV